MPILPAKQPLKLQRHRTPIGNLKQRLSGKGDSMTYSDTLSALYEATVWLALIASVWAISDKIWGQ